MQQRERFGEFQTGFRGLRITCSMAMLETKNRNLLQNCQELIPSLKKRCQEGKFLSIYYQRLANYAQSTVSDICF
jgi:hypothetical protein